MREPLAVRAPVVLVPHCRGAALAASIFHYGTYTVDDLKEHLDRAGIPVRKTH